jgi:hypothetical protein
LHAEHIYSPFFVFTDKQISGNGPQTVIAEAFRNAPKTSGGVTMGLFDKLFGKKEELPPLDPASPAATRMNKFKTDLEAFVGKMHDRLEFVPSDEAVYCFIGKPPAMFGMAWFHDGKEHNLKTLAAAKGLTQKKTQKMSLALGEVYEKYMEEPKFSHMIGGKSVIVHPSEGLRAGVVDVIHNFKIE